jgi:hypothetical protein
MFFRRTEPPLTLDGFSLSNRGHFHASGIPIGDVHDANVFTALVRAIRDSGGNDDVIIWMRRDNQNAGLLLGGQPD